MINIAINSANTFNDEKHVPSSMIKQKIKQNQQQKQLNDNLKIVSRQTKRFQSQIYSMQRSHQEFNNFKGKNQLLMSQFYQVITGSQKKFIPSIKISPIYLIHKIQQSKPYYKNNLLNREILYDVKLEKNIAESSISSTLANKIDGNININMNNTNINININENQEENKNSIHIQNCITSTRPNSQIYKRLSKKFFQNLKNGVDQCMLFIGTQETSRIQTSIGNASNPGIFMIIAIAILDQKYKDKFENFDVQLSFIEYRNQKIYDLLNFTQIPLKPKEKDNFGKTAKVLEFGQNRVKICTFMQFIKYFKIALFNNKQRDFKDQNKTLYEYNKEQKSQNNSSFIMKIRIKRYNKQSQLIYQSQTILIDFQQKSFNKTNFSRANKQNHTQKTQNLIKTNNSLNNGTCGRSLLDYILIQLNNSNPYNKQIHYHMVQKNLLLMILKKFLVKNKPISSLNLNQQGNTFNLSQTKNQDSLHYIGGQIFVVNTMPTHYDSFQKNVNHLRHLLQSIGPDWQAFIYQRHRFNKYLNTSYSQRILRNLIYYLQTKRYQLYKDLQLTKQYFVHETKKIINSINEYRNLIIQYLKIKNECKYNINLLISYQLQLVGNCIKSDNFKQFYSSKVYLSLPRQLSIKTQQIKGQIKKCLNQFSKLQDKYLSLKKKQKQNKIKQNVNQVPTFLLTNIQSNNSQIILNQKQNNYQNNLTNNSKNHSIFKNVSQYKFKKLSHNTNNNNMIGNNQSIMSNMNKYEQLKGLEQFLLLKRYIFEYFNEIWYKINLTQQRTIGQQIIFQESFSNQISQLKQQFKAFIQIFSEIDETKVKFGNEQKLSNTTNLTNLTHLISSLNKSNNKMGLNFNKYEKHVTKFPFKINSLKTDHYKKGQKQNMSMRQTNYLPKINELENKLNLINKKKSLSIKQKKVKNKNQIFQINGKVNFQNLIINPLKGNQSQMCE